MPEFGTCENHHAPQIYLCKDHADKLADALDQHGLTALCADYADQTRLEEILSEEISIDTFDPGLFCQITLIQGVLDHSNGAIVAESIRDGEDKCPICWMNLAHAAVCDGTDCNMPPEGYDVWITAACEYAVEKWRELQP
jgi:hypothetical protein